jgi:hypothetical protein
MKLKVISTLIVYQNIPSECKSSYTGRFILFYVITNIYKEKTKGPTIMDLFPDFETTAQDGGKVVSLTYRPPLPLGNTPGTHFLLEALSKPAP